MACEFGAAGTSGVLGALADEMERSPWALLPAFPPAPLPGRLSSAAALALQSAVEVLAST